MFAVKAIKTTDLLGNIKQISDQVAKGEVFLVSRPRNENIVVISEREYNDMLESKKRQALLAYYAKLDQGLRDIEEGKGISVSLNDLKAME